MGLQAAFVGTRDLFYGVTFIRETTDSAGIELVCANLIDGSSGDTIFNSWITLSHNDKRLAITGLAEHLTGRRIPGFGSWTTVPPDSVINQLRKSLPQNPDLIIMLTDMRESELRRILPSFPEVQLVFTSSRRVITPSPFSIDSAIVVRPMLDGGAVDGVVLPFDWSVSMEINHFSLPLNDEILPDVEMRDWIEECMDRKIR